MAGTFASALAGLGAGLATALAGAFTVLGAAFAGAALAGAANRVNAAIYTLDPRGVIGTMTVVDMAAGVSAAVFYTICGALGFGIGYWAIFVTVAAVLIIAGSGPTDRDGNSTIPGVRPDTLHLIAQGLAAQGISSLRFDKRANNLKLDVIAEGVELDHQLETIKGLDCQYGQGFLFSRPLPVEAMDAWIRLEKVPTS